jgi:hypothetical protein
LCCIGLSLNVVVFAVAIKLFDGPFSNFGTLLVLLGITGTVMLTATVKFVMHHAQVHAQGARQ